MTLDQDSHYQSELPACARSPRHSSHLTHLLLPLSLHTRIPPSPRNLLTLIPAVDIHVDRRQRDGACAEAGEECGGFLKQWDVGGTRTVGLGVGGGGGIGLRESFGSWGGG